MLEPGLSRARGEPSDLSGFFHLINCCKCSGKLLLSLAVILQQILSQEVVSRLMPVRGAEGEMEEDAPTAEMTEMQMRAAFHDAIFCFEEVKKIQR